MKSLFAALALTALIVIPSNIPMVAASAVEPEPSVTVITVSGSAGINL